MGRKARAITGLLKDVNSLTEGFSDPINAIPAGRAVLKVVERIGSLKEDVESLETRCVELLDVVKTSDREMIKAILDDTRRLKDRLKSCKFLRVLRLRHYEEKIAELGRRLEKRLEDIMLESNVRVEDAVDQVEDKVIQFEGKVTRVEEVLVRTNAEFLELQRAVHNAQMRLTSLLIVTVGLF